MSAGTPKSDISQEQVVEIMRGERFVMLTSIAVDGALHSHPMTPQEVTDDADVWFFVGLGTDGHGAQRLHGDDGAAAAQGAVLHVCAHHPSVPRCAPRCQGPWPVRVLPG